MHKHVCIIICTVDIFSVLRATKRDSIAKKNLLEI